MDRVPEDHTGGMICGTRGRTSALAGVALSATLLLAACSTSGSDGASAGSRTASPAAVADGPLADLGFTAQTVDGTAFDGRQLAGKPTVLWFWAPWCATCRAQSGGVQALAEKYAGRVNVVGVGGLDSSDAIVDYAREVTGPIQLIDPEGKLWRHFGIRAQSSYLVLDGTGHIKEQGYLDDPVLAAVVRGLVA